MVMKNGGASHDWQQDDVPLLKKRFPAFSQLKASFVVAEPVAVSHREQTTRSRDRRVTSRTGERFDAVSRRSTSQSRLQEREESIGDSLQRELWSRLRIKPRSLVGERARGIL